MALPPKNVGSTPAEKYLAELCEKSFLLLWSYPNPFRDQGDTKLGGDGKEVCDLLVVFENNVIIFSSKHCEYPNADNILLNWSRWYKRAIADAAKQLYGAESWLKKFPDRLFLDEACVHPFPIPIPPRDEIKVHRIVVAHGASNACQEMLGGTGSLMLNNNVIGSAHYDINKYDVFPFTVGQVAPERGFVHVFDDANLSIVMSELDTINDFIDYLEKKEIFLTQNPFHVITAGEEELLAYYLQNINDFAKPEFIIPAVDIGILFLDQGLWNEFKNSSKWVSKKQVDEVSYLWDLIINYISIHLAKDIMHPSSDYEFSSNENNIRMLAKESRFTRRLLGRSFLEVVEKSRKDDYSVRIVLFPQHSDTCYIYFLSPKVNDAEGRVERQNHLQAYCLVAKLLFFGRMKHVVGIASESGGIKELNSVDITRHDGVHWAEGEKQAAEELHAEGIFSTYTLKDVFDPVYPIE